MSWEQEHSDRFKGYIESLVKGRIEYDEETERQLREVKNSDWHTTKYLREILWELRYMRREANRP